MQKMKMIIFLIPISLWIVLKAALSGIIILLSGNKSYDKSEGPDDYDLICISRVSWNDIWQRNHHTMTQIAKHRKVIYCFTEVAHVAAKNPEKIFPVRPRIIGNLIYINLLRLSGEGKSPLIYKINKLITILEIRRLALKFNFKKPVLWFYFPYQENIVGSLDEALVVYDIQDNYEAFSWAPKNIKKMEENLICKTDVLFTGTDALKEKNQNRHKNITFFPCGVEFDHFSKKDISKIPDDIKNVKSPILGYFGLIDNRIDAALLDYTAEKHPDWNIFMIGPVDERVFKKPSRDNIYFVGQKDYKILPYYLQKFDVCIMPWALNDLTKNINPTKTLEYFASGKPVVTTAIPDMIKHYSDVLGVAYSHEEFASLCEKALQGSEIFNIGKGLQLSKERSWEYITNCMEDIIRKELRKKNN